MNRGGEQRERARSRERKLEPHGRLHVLRERGEESRVVVQTVEAVVAGGQRRGEKKRRIEQGKEGRKIEQQGMGWGLFVCGHRDSGGVRRAFVVVGDGACPSVGLLYNSGDGQKREQNSRQGRWSQVSCKTHEGRGKASGGVDAQKCHCVLQFNPNMPLYFSLTQICHYV